MSVRRENFYIAKNIDIAGRFEAIPSSYRGKCHIVILQDLLKFNLGQMFRMVKSLSVSAHSQEQLTVKIAQILESKSQPSGVGVCLDVQYVGDTGRKDQSLATTVTTMTLRGKLKNQRKLRQEGLRYMQSFG